MARISRRWARSVKDGQGTIEDGQDHWRTGSTSEGWPGLVDDGQDPWRMGRVAGG